MLIKKDMTILDLAEKHPELIQVFKVYDRCFNVCICCESLFETLEQVCKKYGINLDKLLEEINEAIQINS
jgi:hybrid cluster-associated redox disulfide protein